MPALSLGIPIAAAKLVSSSGRRSSSELLRCAVIGLLLFPAPRACEGEDAVLDDACAAAEAAAAAEEAAAAAEEEFAQKQAEAEKVRKRSF